MSTNYIIPAYGPNPEITIYHGMIDTGSTSIKIQGMGAPGYGYTTAENYVRMLSNHANSNPPQGRILVGQFWYDSLKKQPKVWNGTSWSEVVVIDGGGGSLIPPNIGGLGMKPTAADAKKYIRVNDKGDGYIYVAAKDILTDLESAGLSTNYLKANMSSSPTVNNAFDLGTPSRLFANIYATNFIGTASKAKYADLAERYEASEYLENGDVVEFGGTKEVQKARITNDRVFGIVSTNPAYLMNSDAGDDFTHPPIGLVGRMPVKVKGSISKFDKLYLSDVNGVASNVESDSYIGVALASRIDDGAIGLVEVSFVGVR